MIRILPAHEQHYPDHLLPHRLEEYVFDDGRPPTQNRAFAKRVTGRQALDGVLAAQKATGLANIDPFYYVGTCFHEAGCSNEWDTEIASPTCHEGFVSVGAFQIGAEEAKRFGFKLEDMLDFEKSCECFVKLAEANLQAIQAAAGLSSTSKGPDYTDASGKIWVGGTLRAYLAITHNKGVGYMRATVKNYGLNWSAYKWRNPQDPLVGHGYGEDCITGGPFWPEAAPVPPLAHRTLQLTVPWMTGEDVKELQRHLKIKDDGSFGPKTEATLKLFQKGHGLLDDGVCGAKTWAALLATV